MGSGVGKPINVGEVLSKSARMLTKTPALMIPQVIVLAISLLGDLVNSSAFSALGIVLALIGVVVSVVVTGAYPSMVQTILSGGQIDVGDSLGKASRKFWILLVAGIIVGLFAFVGLLALIVPGLVIITWYAYTVPAIMLEDKGIFQGMGASKAFGRDKKWSTFVILLVVGAVAGVIVIIQAVLSLGSPLLGRVIYSLLSVPLEAWAAVVLTYTYITFGPSSIPPASEVIVSGVIPPSPMQSAFQAGPPMTPASSANFCRFCGSPTQADSKFCSICGKPV